MHVMKTGLMYIPLTCNVCHLYIPLTCNIVMSYQCDIPICMFMEHVHTKPVYSTGVYKTNLQYRCAQNQFTVQVNIKPIYITAVHKTRLEYNF